MYDRFTDRARKVMQLANQEAQRFNHEYIGIEHILIALVKEGSGIAATALKTLGADLRRIRLEIEKHTADVPRSIVIGKLPHTERAKKCIESAIGEARTFGHNYVGTEHLLLGMIHDTEGMAIEIFKALGIKTEDIRFETMKLMMFGQNITAHMGPSPALSFFPAKRYIRSCLHGIEQSDLPEGPWESVTPRMIPHGAVAQVHRTDTGVQLWEVPIPVSTFDARIVETITLPEPEVVELSGVSIGELEQESANLAAKNADKPSEFWRNVALTDVSKTISEQAWSAAIERENQIRKQMIDAVGEADKPVERRGREFI